MDTIFALSSGAPPAAIAVVRISGPQAGDALVRMAGSLPKPRHATLTRLRSTEGVLLDEALILWFPGPRSETGEDCAELQLHGGRAVVDGVCKELARYDGLRAAAPGEFTRRAFANGQLDLLQVEGLADLVEAQTEVQRQSAVGILGGRLSKRVEEWNERLLSLSARVEAALDFDDEDDVERLGSEFSADVGDFSGELAEALRAPSAETLRDGFRVALAGPPNSGKSTLFNRLLDFEAAIVSPQAGTTRDVLERSVAIGGMPLTLVDMAGLREESDDAIEVVGIRRAREELARADLVLWLGPEGEGPSGAWEIDARIDRAEHKAKGASRHAVSAATGAGMDELIADLVSAARGALVKPGLTALRRRQREHIAEALEEVRGCKTAGSPLLVAEHLRRARLAFDQLTGRTSTEDMLDALFGRFCIGK